MVRDVSARRYRVDLRRTVEQTQTVEFIADKFPDGDVQHAVAAAYADPERWIDVKDSVAVINLDSEPIEWKVKTD